MLPAVLHDLHLGCELVREQDKQAQSWVWKGRILMEQPIEVLSMALNGQNGRMKTGLEGCLM